MTHYACHNRPPFRQTVELRNERGEVVTSFPFRMAPDCRYTHTELGQADARCDGCKHKAESLREKDDAWKRSVDAGIAAINKRIRATNA